MTGGLSPLNDADRFAEFLAPLYEIDWVVYCHPPEVGPEVVLKYLARYTYRVAISNTRIEAVDGGRVTFRYKDYARGGRWATMTLEADEFLRRFCLHVLPKGFMQVRPFGLLAPCHRAEKLALARRALGVAAPAKTSARATAEEASTCEPRPVCPHCGRGTLWLLRETARPTARDLVTRTYAPSFFDSS
jgi:hypothetical protein